MARTKVILNRRGMDSLMHSRDIESDLERRGGRVADQAKRLAPKVSGAYSDSIEVEVDDHPSRVAVHISAGVPYATKVEASHRVLGQAIDAAGG
jgi:hypothetical protein